jgi:archaellum biogenesis ATPase FlaH
VSDTRRKVAAMTPLVERMNRSHCWIKTTDGPRRLAEPFTEFMLAEHCAGRKAYGLCPIVPGESSCRVACLDLDSHKGETPFEQMLDIAQSIAFLLEQEGYAPHLYRSSGGHGIHIYLMWAEVQDAYSVREMLRGVLAALGYTNGAGGVAAKQIEIFPKQDEVPNDGFGSMFVLPGSGKSEPLGQYDGWIASTDVPVLEKPPRAERAYVATPELDRLKSALDAIPNDTEPLEYDAWRNVVFAIHHATEGSDEGLALAHEFSQRSPKYDPEFLDSRVWPYVGVNSATPVTERSLFALAGQHGWQDPTVADDFEVVEETPEEKQKSKDTLLRFTPIRVAEFSAGKPMEWIIKNVLPHGELGMVFGASGSGKSFLLIDMAAAIARGTPWRDKTVRKGRVCYIVAEGAAGFRKRIDAYCLHNEIAVNELDMYVIADAPNLNQKDHVKALTEGIKSAGHFVLVILDTLAAVTAGADENSAQDMGIILDRARSIGRDTGAMTLLVHHAGKQADRGARGSTALKGRVDVEIEVLRSDNDRAAVVSKLRDQEDGAAFGFQLQVVNVGMDDEGEVIDSCVIEHAATAGAVTRNKPKGKHETAVYKIVLDLMDVGDAPTVEDVLTEYLNRNPHDANLGRDTRRQHAQRALRALIDKGFLVADGLRLRLTGGESDDDGAV